MKSKTSSKTVVVFRMWDGEVIALFPTILATMERQHCLSFQHVGQHCAADPNFVIRNSLPAKPLDYKGLKGELENQYGYELDVKKRYTRKMFYNRERNDLRS